MRLNMKLPLPTSQVLLQVLPLLLLVECGSASGHLASGESVFPTENPRTPPGRQTKCFLRGPADYPVGLYLGPTQLVSSHYDAQDRAVTLAAVPASPVWRQRMLQLAQEGSRDCQWDETPDPHPLWGGCASVLTPFIEAMNAILNATELVLGHTPVIGYIVLPYNTTTFRGLFNMVMHNVFEFYRPARDGCYIEYDILFHRKAAQYAYQLPWHGIRGPIDEDEEEETFFLLADLEPDYLELAGGCILDVCLDSVLRPRAMLDLGEDALWPTASSASSKDGASPSWHFGQVVQKLADAISAFMSGTRRDRFRGVVVAGAASERAMTALRVALRVALPDVNDTQFYDTIQPASVLSLGASVVGRNIQLYDERFDCECLVAEHYRRDEGYPLDDEFPCNRYFARLDMSYY